MGKGAGIARIFTSVLYILTKSPESIYSNYKDTHISRLPRRDSKHLSYRGPRAAAAASGSCSLQESQPKRSFYAYCRNSHQI